MTLPQQHGWQVAFRDFIAAKTLQDFDCGLRGLEYHNAYFGSDDEIYKTWITFENLGRHTAKLTGARIDSCNYLLENIEDDGTGDRPAGIYMKIDETVEPGALAWLYSWDYGGNPWYNKTEIANRAIVACMVDMIMCHDKYIDGNLASISQAVSSAFATWGYVFNTCYSLLGQQETDAWGECMQAFFHKIEEQGPTSIQADMDLPAIVGMYYSTEVLFGYEQRAEDYARLFMDKHFNEAGYIDHGGGFDPSYNGISLKYMLWAALVTEYDFLKDALEEMSKLKAHLTFPEPSGKVYSPSSFATSTTHGAANDQHWTFGRDVAISFLTDEAAYLRYGSRNVDSWMLPFGLKDPDGMLADIESWVDRSNGTQEAFNKWITISDLKPSLWESSIHLQIPQLEWDFYPEDGFYENVDAVISHESSLPPVRREGDYVEQFGSDFITWKLGKMAGVIHTGGLSWWDDSTKLPGLSGGSLCALWFEGMGLGILGRQGGYAGPNPNTWENIDTWATNHVKATKDGQPYSTARDRAPAVNVGMDGDDAIVSITTKMQPEDLGLIVRRSLHASPEGLQVGVICSQGEHAPDTIHEVLPLHLGDDDWVLTEIRFLIDGDWVDEPGQCDAVKVERNSRLMLIEFDQPAECSLSEIWHTTYQGAKTRVQMLCIDIASEGEVNYTISGPYVHELKKI